MSLDAVIFSGNQAVLGGAIFIDELDEVDMLVEGCEFGRFWSGIHNIADVECNDVYVKDIDSLGGTDACDRSGDVTMTCTESDCSITEGGDTPL